MNQHEIYLKMHEACSLKKGDMVRLVRNYKKGDYGCPTTPYRKDDNHIGKIGTIESKNNITYHVHIAKSWEDFPYFCLELIEEEVLKKNPVKEVYCSDCKWYSTKKIYCCEYEDNINYKKSPIRKSIESYKRKCESINANNNCVRYEGSLND